MDDAIQVRPRNVPSVESGGNGPLTQIDRLHVNDSGGYQGRRKQDGIKRACNECRQQKLRCDVVREPFSSCSRCQRLGLACKIEATFRRMEKRRSKRELQRLEGRPSQSSITSSYISTPSILDVVETVQLQEAPVIGSQVIPNPPTRPEDFPALRDSSTIPPTHPAVAEVSGSQASFTNGINLSNWIIPSLEAPGPVSPQKLDHIDLSADEVRDLFQEFFQHYHKFLPFLDPSRSPDYYYKSSRLLFWTIISVASRRYNEDLSLLTSLSISVPRLLWSVLQSVPQSYHDVKALCLLCTWPFPLSSSSRDPTLMLSGIMINLGMQFGLHRPSHAQDFSKFMVTLLPEALRDRLVTWSACKIVAQSVATGYGQPSFIVFDDGLDPQSYDLRTHQISQELRDRLQIETLCQKVTKTLYFMSSTDGIGPNDQKHSIIHSLNEELSQLEMDLANKSDAPAILILYVSCAQLHLRLYNLFDTIGSQNYITSLLLLYEACKQLISLVVNPASETLNYSPNYIFQMILASGFALLKFTITPMSEYIDTSSLKTTFNSAIVAIRKISVSNNDLPGRLADVLAQLKARGNQTYRENNDWQNLQLNVRSRMSMSITFDCLWQWRKGFEANGSKSPTDQISISVPANLTHSPHPSPNPGHCSSSMTAVQQEFNFDSFMFDDFYPLNGILENVTDLSNIDIDVNDRAA